jgi:hypothetical protein
MHDTQNIKTGTLVSTCYFALKLRAIFDIVGWHFEEMSHYIYMVMYCVSYRKTYYKLSVPTFCNSLDTFFSQIFSNI